MFQEEILFEIFINKFKTLCGQGRGHADNIATMRKALELTEIAVNRNNAERAGGKGPVGGLPAVDKSKKQLDLVKRHLEQRKDKTVRLHQKSTNFNFNIN